MSMLPTLFVSHGATVYTTDPADPTHAWLTSWAPRLARSAPRAVVVVSAHHVTSGEWAVTSSASPPLLHDHPVSDLYGERYPAAGDPALAARVADALRGARLQARLDPTRGLDHGAWLPLRALAPHADLPIVGVSVNGAASLEEHIAAGAALAPLRRDGVLVLASGGATHNQEEFRRRFLGRRAGGTELRSVAPADDPPAWSVSFDAWVADTVALADTAMRKHALAQAPLRPEWRLAHPTPDHFWPLLVAIGAAGDDVGRRVHAGFQDGLSTSAFLFGELLP